MKIPPRIIPRSEHHISRSDISDNALKVLYRLSNAGFKAYLVGGGVRDLLLGHKPKDFDVVTDARPDQVRELFRNCRLIGRRFRLAHIRFGDEIIEVSTFRAAYHVTDGERHIEDGRIIRDNIYGDIDDDVWRRDFTANSLFYNIDDQSIVDYVGAMADIEASWLRMIGDPAERYREDPVRMLRAIRFSVKLDFKIHEDTEKQIHELNHLLNDIPPARLFEEFMKLFMSGKSLKVYHLLREFSLFPHMFPLTQQILEQDEARVDSLLHRVFLNTDERIHDDKPVSPGFLIAALLWPSVMEFMEEYKSNGLADQDAIMLASDTVISQQISSISFPRRYTLMARDIWLLQSRMKHRRGKRPMRLLSHPRFKAAYDFLLLRAEAGENLQEMVDWWSDFANRYQDIIEQNRHGRSRFRPSGRRNKSRRS
ncbi:MAG: polynucleotide adenylyltransferase PcnB [Gammaproteobacteria bacterium]|nr:polynucleotide adenylyltransferase PcnB [Gammaproteobacteria bacterium]NIQ75216.1 polynucleotide adenylyltransferase PcnB [Gammaproteobacteria bacterium]NIR26247.1 polynucleotide adenylyltransferase PcnB [Gammaproteobacteria bacterium]NIR96073.1 polynucleotide adenylyltransferase PcnB [Gammaproteobacteria bacterium]NIW47727.1 polynucleotide adenylyltransferase PcnB [Gammaproteobacteria bacterium]